MRIRPFALLLLWLLAACGQPVAQSPTAEVVVEAAADAVATVTDSAETPTTPPEAATSTPEPTVASSEATDLQRAIARQIKLSFPPVNFAKAPIDEPFAMSRWAESSPEAQGLDGAKLAEMAAYIPKELDLIHSVVIARNDTLIYEYYKAGRDENMGDLVWSVTKSFTAVLVGIAVEEGLLSLDQTLGDLLTAEQLAITVPDLATVTVRDLLTMRSGIVCPGDRCHNDALDTVLEETLDYAPGSAFTYDTSATHLLSAVIENATGLPINEYAAEKLFTPLGIAPPPWQVDEDDYAYGGKGLAMRPRDMAKFGQLILNEGVWDGVEVVSAEFVQSATQNQNADISSTPYGYLFWINEAAGYELITALGVGGQYIGIVPELDLVFAITSDFFPPRGGSGSIIEPFILGAVETP